MFDVTSKQFGTHYDVDGMISECGVAYLLE